MLFTAPDRPQRAAQLPEAKHGEPRLPLLRGARAESASSAGAAAQSSGGSSRNFAHLEEHVPPHDRVVFFEGYSPRVGLRVLLEGVEVARARLAEQLDLEALRLAEQRRQRSAGSRAKSGRSGAEEQSAGHAPCCKSGSVRRSSCRAYWGPGGPTAGPSSCAVPPFLASLQASARAPQRRAPRLAHAGQTWARPLRACQRVQQASRLPTLVQIDGGSAEATNPSWAWRRAATERAAVSSA